MNELKTLKDLIRLDHRHPDYDVEVIRVSKLREEAVKEIKILRKLPIKNHYQRFDLPSGHQLTQNIGGVNQGINDVIEYIKWKNNLTEEELK